MRRIALGLLAVWLAAAPAAAQPAPAPMPGRLQPFDHRKAEVRRVNGAWVLLVDGLVVKEFGLRAPNTAPSAPPNRSWSSG
jgi:hypothetical protein